MKKRTLTDVGGVFGSPVKAGIKRDPSKYDLAFLFVPQAKACAGVFTTNKFRAASVTHTENATRNGIVKALVVNAGNANACTGDLGVQAVEETAKIAAEYLGISEQEVAVASTGIIGVPLPMDKVRAGLAKLLTNKNAREGELVEQAILTTDLVEKNTWIERSLSGGVLKIAGITKGSGMIAPSMATTLSYVVLNADVSQERLTEILKRATDKTFNMITVDGEASTNDMVLDFATGEVPVSTEADYLELENALTESLEDLAVQIVKDGEGATKLVEVSVENAASNAQARKIALSICNSPLVKTAMCGEDPNWGRILSAAGKTPDVTIDPTKADLYFGTQQIVKAGVPLGKPREDFKPHLQGKEISVRLVLNVGDGEAKAWTCDLTHGYIDINVAYS